MNIPILRLGCSDYTIEFTSFGELDKLTLNPSDARTVIYDFALSEQTIQI